jgi:RHS repeat-associated protein
MVARYYASSANRFLSTDPKTFADLEDDEEVEGYLSDPQNWNLYSYVLNNPINMTDPDGQDAVAEFLFGESGQGVDTLGELGKIFSVDFLKELAGGARAFAADHEQATMGLSPVPTGTIDAIASGDLAGAAKGVARDMAINLVAGATLKVLGASVGVLSKPTQVALGGGKHSGFLRNYAGKTSAELRRADRSFSKQISTHKGKLSAAKKAGNKNLVKYYRKEIRNLKQQRAIVRDLRKAR